MEQASIIIFLPPRWLKSLQYFYSQIPQPTFAPMMWKRFRDRIECCELDWCGSGYVQVESSCKLGNEPSGSIKC
jgi:hypothetical protein